MSSTHDNENDEDTEDENAPTYSAEDLDLSNDANAEISTEDSLLAISTDQHRSRSAVSATFRGFCSEAFVYGRCTRQSSGCTFDHSTAGQERCIQSFTLLAKRELQQHG